MGGIDTYGVNHNNFSLRDEIEYQFARQKRENQLMQQYNNQGITENYPQYGTNFWGNSANNYGFGMTNIAGNIENMQNNFSPIPLRTRRFKMKTVDRVWFLSHSDWIYRNRHKLRNRPCADFVVTGFVINSFGCPYYGYVIDKISLGNLINLWNNGFVYKNFPLVHYRISHGDSSTNIAYIYRGKVFSHRFPYTDQNRYIPTEEVKKILKELRED